MSCNFLIFSGKRSGILDYLTTKWFRNGLGYLRSLGYSFIEFIVYNLSFRPRILCISFLETPLFLEFHFTFLSKDKVDNMYQNLPTQSGRKFPFLSRFSYRWSHWTNDFSWIETVFFMRYIIGVFPTNQKLHQVVLCWEDVGTYCVVRYPEIWNLQGPDYFQLLHRGRLRDCHRIDLPWLCYDSICFESLRSNLTCCLFRINIKSSLTIYLNVHFGTIMFQIESAASMFQHYFISLPCTAFVTWLLRCCNVLAQWTLTAQPTAKVTTQPLLPKNLVIGRCGISCRILWK